MSGLFAQSIAIIIEKIQYGVSKIETEAKKAIAKNRRAEVSIQNKVCSSNIRGMNERGGKEERRRGGEREKNGGGRGVGYMSE